MVVPKASNRDFTQMNGMNNEPAFILNPLPLAYQVNALPIENWAGEGLNMNPLEYNANMQLCNGAKQTCIIVYSRCECPMKTYRFIDLSMHVMLSTPGHHLHTHVTCNHMMPCQTVNTPVTFLFLKLYLTMGNVIECSICPAIAIKTLSHNHIFQSSSVKFHSPMPLRY